VPRLEASLDPELRRRFLREARAAAGLDHPNLVPVHEAGETGPFCYIVSAYCRGDTLAAWLRGRSAPVPPRAAAALAAALADGVAHVHGRGILHRDIKPGNVLLEPADPGALEGLGVTPRLTDFGLVKLVGSDTQQTASGALVGTPQYMAPEQAEGRLDRVGPHTDVYALGAVLYELLTGRPTFEAASFLDTLVQVRTREPVPPRQLRPEVPRDLETICLHCLHKEPLRRYPSARALAEDLRRFLRGEPVLARRVGRLERLGRWVKRRPAAAALAAVSSLAVVALLGLGFWFSAQVGAARGALDGARQVADTEKFFGLLRAVEKRSVRREPGWTWANLEDLHRAADLPAAAEHLEELRSETADALGAIDVRPARVVGQGFNVDSLAFHPSGRWLALGGTNVEQHQPCTVRLIDLERTDGDRSLSFEAGAAWNRMHEPVPDGVRSLAFSPDGRWLVAGARSGWIHRWDLAQQAPACVSWAGHAAAVKWLLFSTDGGALFSASGEGHDDVKRWSCSMWGQQTGDPQPDRT
jgi:hypothetical protein